ncbi:RING-H2 finger protein ATL80-like [Chenopodium quinoa]|uniref:RING-H2 finger protein ATL80-like n=1 Tax=Chenopodium quinoa TaxID=63459 RepID=UPI000B781FBA|nr:RING-H2 finger protein ATL80-like [Chenopodium quinoa]
MRFLRSLNNNTTTSSPPSSDDTETVDSDFVVILAALLCALICVLGLVAVARCAWLRRFAGGAASAPANKGLKKKVLKALPKVAYSAEQHAGKLSDDCAICLSDFSAGEEIRILPQCGHGFHVSCIDTWLGSHSSCPSCRQILAVRCQKCGGGLPENSAAGAPTSTDNNHNHNHIHNNTFLP